MLCMFAYQRGAPFSPHRTFAENDNLIIMDIVATNFPYLVVFEDCVARPGQYAQDIAITLILQLKAEK